MNKVRFLFLILALVLVVGMTTGLIVRKQSGGQTVMQHSGAPAPVSTTPATTEESEESLGLEDLGYRIPVFVSSGKMDKVRISVHGEVIPSSGVASLPDGYVDSKAGNTDSKGDNNPDPEPEDPDPEYVDYYVFYIDPDDSEVTLSSTSLSKPADTFAWVKYVYYPNLQGLEDSEISYSYDEIRNSPSTIRSFSDVCFVVIE